MQTQKGLQHSNAPYLLTKFKILCKLYLFILRDKRPPFFFPSPVISPNAAASNRIKNNNNNNNKLKIIRRKIFIAISEALTWNENYAKSEIRRRRRRRGRKKIFFIFHAKLKKKNISLYTCRANNFQFTPLTLERSSEFSFQLSKTLAKIESGC